MAYSYDLSEAAAKRTMKAIVMLRLEDSHLTMEKIEIILRRDENAANPDQMAVKFIDWALRQDGGEVDMVRQPILMAMRGAVDLHRAICRQERARQDVLHAVGLGESGQEAS